MYSDRRKKIYSKLWKVTENFISLDSFVCKITEEIITCTFTDSRCSLMRSKFARSVITRAIIIDRVTDVTDYQSALHFCCFFFLYCAPKPNNRAAYFGVRSREIAHAAAYVTRLRQPISTGHPVAGLCAQTGNRSCNRRTYFWKHGGRLCVDPISGAKTAACRPLLAARLLSLPSHFSRCCNQMKRLKIQRR